jgi:hypothetical protein
MSFAGLCTHSTFLSKHEQKMNISVHFYLHHKWQNIVGVTCFKQML